MVQGVGFRPFVFRLAQMHALAGWVLNSTEGVVIEVEGEGITAFLRDLTEKAPPLARIDRVEVSELPPVGYASFAIHESESEDAGAIALVSPDVAVCDDCLREVADAANRRFRYPFTNCTNCGPRFTIVQDVPYDRPQTTMRAFKMCPACQREYDDPADRRFHAQPNACPACGPQLRLLSANGARERDAALLEAQRLLRAGAIVAVKGLGGFHLACDATNAAAVAELRRRKGRAEKPFAVMALDRAAVQAICEPSEDEWRLLVSPQRPIVLLRKRRGSAIAEEVAPRNACLGVMLPYTPLHYLLLQGEMPVALVMTSGNFSEEPIATDNQEALARLAPLADAFLLHDRPIHVRCDDSVTRVFAGREAIVRRSRGYAPYPVRFATNVRQILACGAELKNTFCLTRDNYAFLSHHIGDLENAETLRSFEEGIAHFQRLFRVAPEAVAYDLHPDYLSTKYALGLATAGRFTRHQLIGVQHHHAHVASCMAEHGLTGRVIGVAFDGTGYGLDGAVWGGEFLVASYADFERVGHLAYVALPGGAAAIRRPYRMALSYVYAAIGDLEPALPVLRESLAASWTGRAVGDHPSGRSDGELEGALRTAEAAAQPPLPLSRVELAILDRQVRGTLGSPPTSSCGRLFDAVAALAGVRQVVTYEGQAAIELEMAADPGVGAAYPLPVLVDRHPFVVDHRPLIRAVLADVAAAVPAGEISAKFHNAVARAIVSGCLRARDLSGLRRVVLSGGVFQNLLLLSRAVALLEEADFDVYLHHQVPCNDGGISLGQAAVANARLIG